jgi:hypothetical protein
MTEICWCNSKAIKINHEYKVYQIYVGGLIPNQDMVGVDTMTRVTEDMLENRIKKLELKGYIKA